jgi:hypothetical protein
MEVNTDLNCENSQSEMWHDRLVFADIPTQLWHDRLRLTDIPTQLWHDRLGLTDIPTQLNLREKKTLEGKDENVAVTCAALKLQQGRRFLAH